MGALQDRAGSGENCAEDPCPPAEYDEPTEPPPEPAAPYPPPPGGACTGGRMGGNGAEAERRGDSEGAAPGW
ncbi:hypothetical protein GCM10010321_62400 [Streptomyces chartreusis]|nr:hypothetical protein GCM10010321_62400 [Streptomyces chartreusis]